MWVLEMNNKVDGAELPATVQEWSKHCILRVPPRFKTGKNVFKPQMVALGPFHHNDAPLRSMEKHKLRAVRHLLRRAGKSLGDLAAAVEGVATNLEDSYAELGTEWRGQNRDKFLEMMIADGCFLLEFMRNYITELENPKKQIPCDYLENDPVFGPHAVVHIGFFVQRDMLLIENQLPLILLRSIVAVETGQTMSDDSPINQLVLHFLHQDRKRAASASSRVGHGLHPLDLYRRSLLRQSFVPDEQANPSSLGCCLLRQHTTNNSRAVFVPMPLPSMAPENKEDDRERAVARSAQKLYEAGIWFKRRKPDGIDNIDFNKGKNCNTLEMPRVVLDDSSEYKYHNLMAFEALHAGAGGNEVTAFVLFMRDLVDSAADVDLLRRKGILDNHLAGGDWAVVRLLSRLTRDVAEIKRSPLCIVRSAMESYCVDRTWAWRVLIFKWWANLRASHLSNIWTFIALLAGIFLLGTDIVQTVFSVKSYVYTVKTYELEKGNPS